MNRYALITLSCALLFGCSKADAPKGPAGQVASPSSGSNPIKPAIPDRPKGEVFVDGVRFQLVDTPAGKEARYEGTLHNTSSEPVHGVDLSITLATPDGAGIGGQATQSYFQPPLAAGATQPLLIQLPALKTKDGFTELVAAIGVNKVLPPQEAVQEAAGVPQDDPIKEVDPVSPGAEAEPIGPETMEPTP